MIKITKQIRHIVILIFFNNNCASPHILIIYTSYKYYLILRNYTLIGRKERNLLQSLKKNSDIIYKIHLKHIYIFRLIFL